MAEQAASDPKSAYPPVAMLADLRDGIWSELKGDPVDVDLYRRNLQRAYLEILIGEVGRDVASSDLPALARAELNSLLDEVKAANSKVMKPMAQIHLDDIRFRINEALLPKSIAPSSPPSLPSRIILGGDSEGPGDQP